MGDCGRPVGRRPEWMNWDQWDAIACKCALPPGHDGPHRCVDHDGVVRAALDAEREGQGNG